MVFSRRQIARLNRGRFPCDVPPTGSPPPGPADPLSIVTSRTPFWFLSGDLGITIGTKVSAWADQSGNGKHFSQATGGNQPAYDATDADFGGRGALSGDGGDTLISTLWDPPAPGTQNIWFFAVLRQISWTSGRYVWNGVNATTLYLAQVSATPTLGQNNGTLTNNNTAAAIGASVRVEELFSNSINDYLKIGSTSVGGTSAGNGNSTASFGLFGRSTGANASNVKIACVGAWNGKPSAGETSALDAWVTAYYGGSVLV